MIVPANTQPWYGSPPPPPAVYGAGGAGSIPPPLPNSVPVSCATTTSFVTSGSGSSAVSSIVASGGEVTVIDKVSETLPPGPATVEVIVYSPGTSYTVNPLVEFVLSPLPKVILLEVTWLVVVAFTKTSCGASPRVVEPSINSKDTVGAGGALTTTLPRLTVVDCPSAVSTVSFGTYVAALENLCVITGFGVLSKLPSPHSQWYSEIFVKPFEPLALNVIGTWVKTVLSSITNDADGAPNCALIKFGICIDLSVPTALVTDCFTRPLAPSVLTL